MHWSPEHAAPLSQWPEQHLDVTSTTSPSSAHKHDTYAAAARRGYATAGYPWASDDISALTASSLLKRYAEKYSGLELSYDRPATGAYSEPGTFLKTESDTWALGQGIDCYPGLEGLTSSKVGSASVGIPATGSVTVVSSNLASDSGYSSAGSCTAPTSQEYPPTYNSTYLSGYCSQPSASLPPASLHSLQATATLVPSYSASTAVYNYPPGCYPHTQTSLSSGYSHSSASYLPSGISAPTPLAPRPTMVGGSYSYPSHSGGNSETGAALKRKAFEMAEEGQEGPDGDSSRYRKYGNGHGNSHSKGPGNGHGNGYDMSSSDPQVYKPAKPLMSPPYGGAGDYSPPSGLAGENVSREHSFPQQRMPVKIPATHARPEDPSGGR